MPPKNEKHENKKAQRTEQSANSESERQRLQEALAKPLNERHPTNYAEALAGEEADGGESVLGGAPREGEAKHVKQAANQPHPPQPHSPKPNDR